MNNPNLDIFQYVIARVARLPLEVLNQYDAHPCVQLLDHHQALHNRRKDIKTIIEESIYNLVSEQNDHIVQNQLLTLKRAIYNDKLRAKIFRTCMPHINSELKNHISEFQKITAELTGIITKGEKIYEEELLSKRALVRQILLNEDLRKALVVSSPSLSSRIEKILSQDIKVRNKKIANTEITLWQYITRITTKTSPFSAFTHIGVFHLTHEQEKNGIFEKELKDYPSFASKPQVNNKYIHYLKSALCDQPELRKKLAIRLNPSISINENLITLINTVSKKEKVVSFESSPLFRILHKELSTPDKVYNYEGLVKWASSHHNKIKDVDIKNYLDFLIKNEVLELGYDISPLNRDWMHKLLEFFTPLVFEIPMLQKAVASLKSLIDQIDEYPDIAYHQRPEYLQSYFDSLHFLYKLFKEKNDQSLLEKQLGSSNLLLIQAAIDNKLNRSVREQRKKNHNKAQNKNDLPGLSPNNIILEDYHWTTIIKADSHALQMLLSPIKDYLKSSILTWFDKERERLNRFFVDSFHKDDTIPFDRFFDAYLLKVLYPNLSYLKKLRTNRSTNEKPKYYRTPICEDHIKSTQDRCLNYAKELMKAHANKPEYLDINLPISEPNNHRSVAHKMRDSFSLYIQLFRDKDSSDIYEKAVVNNINPGFGKWMSRFLPLFDSDIADQMKQRNISFQGERIKYAEIFDVRTSNTGLHPPLMPYEISYPKSQNQLPRSKQIPVNDISIEFDKSRDQVIIKQVSTQCEIKTFYLCFNSLPGYSEIFNVLSLFSDSRIFHKYYLLDNINGHYRYENKGNPIDCIISLPRVTLSKRLVLQRKHWIIPKSLLPLKKTGMSGWEYYHFLFEWHKSNNIPNDVFIQISTYQEVKRIRKKDNKALKANAYKPQFISFANPLSVMHFLQLIRKVPSQLIISEMLPQRSEGIKINNKRYACEYLCEINA